MVLTSTESVEARSRGIAALFRSAEQRSQRGCGGARMQSEPSWRTTSVGTPLLHPARMSPLPGADQRQGGAACGLRPAAPDHRRGRTTRWPRLKVLTHPAVLVADEIGYLPITRTGAMLFFQLMRGHPPSPPATEGSPPARAQPEPLRGHPPSPLRPKGALLRGRSPSPLARPTAEAHLRARMGRKVVDKERGPDRLTDQAPTKARRRS